MFPTLNNIQKTLLVFVSLLLFSAVVVVGAWGGLKISKRQFEAEAQNIVAVLRSGMSVLDGVATSLAASHNNFNEHENRNIQLAKVLGTYDFVTALGRFENITGSEFDEFNKQLVSVSGADAMVWRYTNDGTVAGITNSDVRQQHFPLSLVKSRIGIEESVDLTGLDLASFSGARKAIEHSALVDRNNIISLPDAWQRSGQLLILRATNQGKVLNGGYMLEVNLEEMASAGGVALGKFGLSLGMFSEQSEFEANSQTEVIYQQNLNAESSGLLSAWFDKNRWLSSFDVGEKILILEVDRAIRFPAKLLVAIALASIFLPLVFLSIVQLITKRNQALKLQRIGSEKLYHAQHRASVTLASIDDGVITTDVNNTILYANGAAENLLGCVAADMQGRTIDDIVVRRDARASDDVTDDSTITLLAADGSTIHVNKKESILKDSDGEQSGKVVVLRDVSVERSLTQELEYKVLHDSLTGLANRLRFEQRIDHLCESTEPNAVGHTIFFIDLDRFKEVNDTCGHGAGDELLIKISEAFKRNVRDQDIVARLGGDEFGIILFECSKEGAHIVAGRILEFFQSFYFEFDEHVFPVRCSIGLVHFDPQTSNRNEVIKAADAACYDAKNEGRNGICERTVDEAPKGEDNTVLLLPGIKEALKNDNFSLFVQSIASTGDGSVNSYECLLRMENHDGTLIGPAAFMKTAIRYEIATDIDRWVITQVLANINKLPAKFSKDNFSINLTAQSLASTEFLEFLIGEILLSKIDRSRLCFDIKEDDALNNSADVEVFCTKLKAIGCRVALDDFGATMTSLSTLKSLSLSALKIDGSLIAGLGATDDVTNADHLLVRAISNFASGLGLTTIAEQVEDPRCVKILRELNVEYAQGFAIAQPVPWESLVAEYGREPQDRAA